MNSAPQFLTIRETAKTGILSEHALRIMHKEGRVPHIMCGKKCMVNYSMLLEQLDEESRQGVVNK